MFNIFNNEQRIKEWNKKQLHKIELQNEVIRCKAEQKRLKNKYKRKISSSKIFYYLLILNCTIIEAYCMWITYKALVSYGTLDWQAILAVIGAVFVESINYLIYCDKSKKENTKGGIVYDMAMKDKTDG